MTEIALGSLLLTSLILLLTLSVVLIRSVLLPSKPAILTVNGTTRIETRTGTRLLLALSDNDIHVPAACAGAGTCGLCRVRVTRGGGEVLPTETARLSRTELRDGMRLACQVALRGDIEVDVAEDLLNAENYECHVHSIRHLTPLICEITLALPDGVRPDIVTGSFVQITVPAFSLDFADLDIPEAHHSIWKSLRTLAVKSSNPTTRAYSIANRPIDSADGRLVLDIRLALPPPSIANAPPGIVSSWLFGLSQGDPVNICGPFTSFQARSSSAEMVFIGGGVGMAPLRAIIFDQLERLGTNRKISYWYGARSQTDLFYQDEFDALATNHPNFNWTIALSDPKPEDNWTGTTGFVHQVVFEQYLKNHPNPEACEYYLCGPPLMIRAVMAMLEDAGVDKNNIFNDDFGI